MNVNLFIDRLVLDGLTLDPAARAELQAAIEQALTQMIAERGIANRLRSDGTWASVPVQHLQIETTHDPGVLGQQVAGAIYKGINS